MRMIKRFFFCLTLLLIAVGLLIDEAYAWYSDYSYRKQITVQATNIDSNLTDFPLYVDITDDSQIGSHMQDTENYYDIRFTNSNDSLLPYECESMSISAGVANGHYWVKTDLDSSSGATIYCYYGKSGDSNGSNATGVWSDYSMVYHLDEPSGTTGSGSVTDSSGNTSGTPSSGISFGQTGKAGNCADFSSGTGINCGSIGSPLLTAETTISYWINVVDRASPARQNPFDQAYGGWSTQTLETNGNMSWYFGSNGGNSEPYTSYYASGVVTNGTWTYLTAVRNPNDSYSYKWYKDGDYYSGSTYDSSYPVISTRTFTIGDGYVYPLNGKIDEFRVCQSARSADEINFEYHNMYESDNELTWVDEATETWLSGYGYRKQITVQATNIDSNLTDFPLYVDITNDSDIGSHMTDTSSYYDIRFTDSNNNVLPYECEAMSISDNIANGHYWVKTDLDSSSGATIYCYYGKSGATDGSNAAGVWSDNYVAVWHMNEASWNGTTDEVKDSLGTNDGTRGGGATTTADGKIYRGGIFDGDGDYVDCGNDTSLQGVNYSQDWTISMWIYPLDVDPSAYRYMIRKTGSWGICFPSWGEEGQMIFYDLVNYGSTFTNYYALSAGSWQYLVLTGQGSLANVDIYVDKVDETSGTTSDDSYPGSAGNFQIGGYTSQNFYGSLDELRVTSDVRTTAEIKFEYHNMSESDNELDWGSESTSGVSNMMFEGIGLEGVKIE